MFADQWLDLSVSPFVKQILCNTVQANVAAYSSHNVL